ncbi:hypothetical protein H113_02532 [Trichophyton rubrum MR1459]|nr:hypothetical protein H113_02532 [Trichophyton rubrum MR1459]
MQERGKRSKRASRVCNIRLDRQIDRQEAGLIVMEANELESANYYQLSTLLGKEEIKPC